MSVLISSNMSLPIPSVGSEQGPDYAYDINSCLTLVDQHDHSPGYGVQITPSGLNINIDLPFGGNFATNIAGVTFAPQSVTPSNNTIYENGDDLFFVDGNGNDVRITQSGAVAGTPGSISNLVPPASASYVSGSATFVWQSDANIAANLDAASILLRNISPNSDESVTITPPNALASSYTLTLPLIPVAQYFLTLDNTGAIAAAIPFSMGITAANIANATITATQIANETITATQIADDTITADKLADGTIPPEKLEVVSDGTTLAIKNIATTATSPTSFGTFSTASTPPVGRPVLIRATPNGYLFTVSAANATAGATYTNNGATFTVNNTIVGGTSLTMTNSSTHAPSASGTLTKTSGTGDATITFSAFVGGSDILSGLFFNVSNTPNSQYAVVEIVRSSDETVVGMATYGRNGAISGTYTFSVPASGLNCIDISDGTSTYFLRIHNTFSSANTVSVTQITLSAVVI